MIKKFAAVAATALLLSGCDTYLTTDGHENDAPTVPDGCVALYQHEWSDDGSDDKFAGVYCLDESAPVSPDEDLETQP